MGRETLERHQVWFYLAAVALGLLAGTVWPEAGHTTEALVWPVLALLLYATFTQMPLASFPAAFKDVRFLTTALVGNFVLIPAVVWALIQFAPDDQALRLGLLLVLLVPCTDWFITFTQLGRGDATRATVLTPITLLLQLLLLPLYLWLLLTSTSQLSSHSPMSGRRSSWCSLHLLWPVSPKHGLARAPTVAVGSSVWAGGQCRCWLS